MKKKITDTTSVKTELDGRTSYTILYMLFYDIVYERDYFDIEGGRAKIWIGDKCYLESKKFWRKVKKMCGGRMYPGFDYPDKMLNTYPTRHK